LTEQDKRLELELKEAVETARTAAAAAASSPMPSGLTTDDSHHPQGSEC